MKWKVLKEEKPEKNCLCYVTNIKNTTHGYASTVCSYQKDFDYFRCQRTSMPVEVTHYVILPSEPPKEWDSNL